jgi:hypothetical protein
MCHISRSFSLLRLFQRICPSLRSCVTFRNTLLFTRWGIISSRPTLKLGTTSCRPSATAYSILWRAYPLLGTNILKGEAMWRVYLLLGNGAVNTFSQKKMRWTIGRQLVGNGTVNTPFNNRKPRFLCGACKVVIRSVRQRSRSRVGTK